MHNTLTENTFLSKIQGFWPVRAGESLSKLAHIGKSLAYCLRPRRISSVLPMCIVLARDYTRFSQNGILPDSGKASVKAGGLCGIARDLGPATLKNAYRNGMFPRNHIGPVKWWSPSQRTVLFFDEYKVDKNVRRKLRNNHFSFTMDKAFGDVVRACAQPRPGAVGLTWINKKIIEAFTAAHETGNAHSLEVWDKDGNLVGGVYGYVCGKVFFTESQFYQARDASKAGFAVLNRHLQQWDFAINDAKDYTSHLGNLGFAPITKENFDGILGEYGDETGGSCPTWEIDPELCDDKWQPADASGLKRHDVVSQMFCAVKGKSS